MLQRAEGIGGYQALYLEQYAELVQPLIFQNQYNSPLLDFLNIQEVFQVQANSPDILSLQNPSALPRAFVVHNFTRISDTHDAAFFHSSEFQPAQTVYLNTDPSPPPEPLEEDDDNDRVYLRSYEENKIDLTVALEKPGILTLSEVYYPGWHAIVNDEPTPILQANLAFRAIALPAGVHSVSLSFDPLSFKIGRAISLLTLIAIGGYALYSYSLRRRNRS